MAPHTRKAAAVAAGLALAAATIVGTAGPAGAEGTHENCSDGFFPIFDNGPITDPIHHNVEPLVEQLVPGSTYLTHDVIQCGVLVGVESQTLSLLEPGGIADYLEDVRCGLSSLLGGDC